MMDRRGVLGTLAASAAAATSLPSSASARQAPGNSADKALPTGPADRAYMLGILEKMALPALERMASGRLRREWKPDVSPTWDGRPIEVAYMEAFGRLIDGLAPWLALPDDDSAEGRLRRRIRDLALQSYVHSADPKSPDRLAWEGHGQTLVDSAYFTSALLRAPDAIKGLRRVSPPYQNWLLFASMNEAFLYSVGEDWDPMRIDLTVKLFSENWYAGDGWYQDGEDFHFDYYNSYVIHPMLVMVLETLTRGSPAFNNLQPKVELERALKRMQRFGEHLERMIGPDGAYAAIGRSLTYRTAAHQVLGVLAWRDWLPKGLAPAKVRAATVAAQRRVFADPSNFDSRGFLTIGFTRAQPSLGDWYSNAGSMYIASESLVALGLPANAPYWTLPGEPWTMRLAYSGRDFPKDYPVKY